MLAAQLAIALASAWALGWITRRVRLPPLLGMILGGVLAGSLLLPLLPGAGAADTAATLAAVAGHLRRAVLALVLLRAGMELSLSDLRRAGGLTLRLGLVPMLGDAALVALGGYWLLGLAPGHAAVLGFLVAAVSPAVVIPGLTEMVTRRQGDARRVPTALLTAAPLDNVLAVLGLGLALDLALASGGSWLMTLARVPYALGGGALVGLLVGAPAAMLLRRTAHRLIAVGLWASMALLIPACDVLGLSFVVAILVAGVTLRTLAPDAAPVLGPHLARLWTAAQVVLFGLIGVAVDLPAMATVGLAATAVIALGQLGRAAGVALATAGTGLGGRERLACALAFIPKATIQAAFAALPLERGLASGEVLLGAAILAVVLTVPPGVYALHRGTDALLPDEPLADPRPDGREHAEGSFTST